TAADVIVKAAQNRIVDGAGDKLQKLMEPGAQIGAPQNLQEDGLREFHGAIAEIGKLAAQEDVVALADAKRGSADLNGFGLGAQVAVEQIGQLIGNRLRIPRHFFRLVAIERRDFGQHAQEGGLAQPFILGKVAADKERLALGIEEDVERPAALVAHDVGRRL